MKVGEIHEEDILVLPQEKEVILDIGLAHRTKIVLQNDVLIVLLLLRVIVIEQLEIDQDLPVDIRIVQTVLIEGNSLNKNLIATSICHLTARVFVNQMPAI